MMGTEEQKRVRVAVEEILEVADMKEVTERKVRNLAAEKTGIDLSTNREWKGFVSGVIAKFFESRSYTSDAEEEKPSPEEEKPGIREVSRDSSSGKMKGMEETKEEKKEMEDAKENEDVNDQDHEDDEEETSRERKKPKYEVDEEGNITICELSAKRKVVVSQWKGKTLISVREYYEKDGKVLPTSKGISLTEEQFQVLANSVNDIDSAISSLQ